MPKPLAILIVVGLFGSCPIWANAKPHHGHHVVAFRNATPPLVLHVLPLSYDRLQSRGTSSLEYHPVKIGAADSLPLGAADHFGRGGVASIGYHTGAARSPIEAHELNAAFSSQQIGLGGTVGGDVSIHF